MAWAEFILLIPLLRAKNTLLSRGIEIAFIDLDLGSILARIIVSVLVPAHISFFASGLSSTPRSKIFCRFIPKGVGKLACCFFSLENARLTGDSSPKIFDEISSGSTKITIPNKITRNINTEITTVRFILEVLFSSCSLL